MTDITDENLRKEMVAYLDGLEDGGLEDEYRASIMKKYNLSATQALIVVNKWAIDKRNTE